MRLKTTVTVAMPRPIVSKVTPVKPGFFSSWRKANFRSFIPQRLHRIDLRRAPRRQPAGKQSSGDQKHDDACECQRVRRRDAVELARDETRCRQAADQSGNTAQSDGL